MVVLVFVVASVVGVRRRRHPSRRRAAARRQTREYFQEVLTHIPAAQLEGIYATILRARHVAAGTDQANTPGGASSGGMDGDMDGDMSGTSGSMNYTDSGHRV